jgi:hypothetical protein
MTKIATIALCLLPTAAILTLIYIVPTVNRWEREANYPYGKMCRSVFTAFVDTCKR